MAGSNHADDCSDIARLFIENDDLGAQSSLWFRPLRHLLEQGKPAGAMTFLAFRGPHMNAYLFGAITHTQRNRIVFWPVLPKNADMVAAEGKVGVIDHITLELSNEKTHVTAYNAAGEPSRCGATDLGHPQAWRLQRFEGGGLAVWFTLLVNWSTLVDQETAVQRCTNAPNPAEAERRKRAFADYAAQLTIVDVPLPKCVTTPEYVYCVIYLVADPKREIKLTPGMFIQRGVDSQVDGWPDGAEFTIQATKLCCERTQFVIATACPPGITRRDVVLGFPRRTA
jgi:hypothetical protein